MTRRSLAAARAAQRGTSILEAMIAMAIVLVGLLGFAGLQIVTSRANQFNKRMSQATAVAMDLAENVKRWPYTDPRLETVAAVTSLEDESIEDSWDLGRSADLETKQHFSDKVSDPNASSSGALETGYQGVSTDADGDGKADFTRYWNVYALDVGSSGTPNGKLVQIIVRWKEPGFGFRQVTTVAFKPNPQSIFQ
jgi:type II secretory pathway pseudopilin PulG